MSKVLVVSNISKAFFSYKSELSRIISWFIPFFQASSDRKDVLQDVSFNVSQGEILGVIGGNGAGKSSLLKIIAGTMQQTSGQFIVKGSVSAILELGMGFHPELSGRQNAINIAKLMGRRSSEVELEVPEIEKFSDIGAYFDLPVRLYSNGMQVRVAFAVATAFRPDLLIVDEALSVGDASFQRKCFRKIEGFRRKGTAILLVSHDLEMIKRVCSKAVFIKEGTVKYFGSVKQASALYERDTLSGSVSSKHDNSALSACLYESTEAKITSYWIENSCGKQVNRIQTGESGVFCYQVSVFADIDSPVFNMQIKTNDGVTISGINSKLLKFEVQDMKAGSDIVIQFSFVTHLAPGDYYFSCGIKDKNGDKFFHRALDCCVLKVLQRNNPTVAMGLVDLNSSISIQEITE